jgi:carbon-monoxide dehydrogenase medium subunit
VAEAIGLLSKLENARLLAGGQSLMAMLNLRYVQPDHLIDINRIAELAFIDRKDGLLKIGAMTRQHRIQTDTEVKGAVPILAEALAQVGHRQTRNRGTIGGSLCHLDPAAELPAMAVLHDAVLHVAGPDGRRSLPMAGFMTGYMATSLKAGELLTSVDFPVWPAGHGYSFLEFSRRHGDFAVAAAACLMTLNKVGAISRIAVAVSGVEVLPRRLKQAEAMLLGNKGDEALFAKAAEHCQGLEAVVDVHADRDYRLRVASTMVRRSLCQAYSRAAKGG